MATASESKKTRLHIAAQTMRELMFASGGRCAMTDCALPLTSPTGGWIGTVAHIIGAEKGGARGGGPETPAERASFANLMLMCGSHGREVDAPATGEKHFPIDKLRMMKQAHEAKVTEAVAAAVEQERSGVQTATGSIDTSLRASTAATTAEGLAESLGLDDTDGVERTQIVEGLATARARFQQLSQPALDTLEQLLEVWMQECRVGAGETFDFGESYRASSPHLPCDHVDNRVMRGGETINARGISELRTRGFVDIFVDEDEGVAYYTFESLWRDTVWAYTFWPSAAMFLYDGHGVAVHEWAKGLDFSIFDRLASTGREVPWR